MERYLAGQSEESGELAGGVTKTVAQSWADRPS